MVSIMTKAQHPPPVPEAMKDLTPASRIPHVKGRGRWGCLVHEGSQWCVVMCGEWIVCHWMSLGVNVPYRCWCCWHGGGGQSATVAGLQVRAVMDAGYDPIMLLLLVLACLLRSRQV